MANLKQLASGIFRHSFLFMPVAKYTFVSFFILASKPSHVISTDQSMLDDIEKTLNDDMKRIISWLQQLKYVHPFHFSRVIMNESLWNCAQTQEFHFEEL